MHSIKFPALRLIFGLTSLAVLNPAQAQLFTVQVGQSAAAPLPLVNHTNNWHYRKGTNEPPADWRTADNASLDASWLTGGGGIGYGDGDDVTVLSDMRTNYLTVYVRQSFTVMSPVNTNQHLQLTADYDDGFIAYLDGVELLRSPNVPGTAGTPHPFNQGLTTGHEARGYQGLSVDVFDAGAVGNRLAPGVHILAVQGINDDILSSDLSLSVDLALTGTTSADISGPLLSIIFSNQVTLSGSNTFPGSARVWVDGAEAAFNVGQSTWSHTAPLQPGYNRLLIQAVDGAGIPLYSTNEVIISELASTAVGGTLPGSAVWNSSMGIIRVTNSVVVPPGATLDIEPGAVVLLGAALNLRATNDASIQVNGTENNIACLASADGSTMWGEIAADGSNSVLTVRHAETIGGAVKGRNGATCLLEDSYFHDYKNGTVPIGGCTSARSMTVRGCHFRIYHETLWQNTLMTVEENLFEQANNPSSDALDFDGATVGSVIRHCTFRHGPQSNTDAIDLGPTTSGIGSTNTLVEDCLMFDFPNDKGVSIGEGSYGIVVRNCLMYGNDSGVSVKDSPGNPRKPPCTANIYNCTIADCDYGFRCYNKSDPASATDGGQVTNSYNNILWNARLATFEILNGGIVIADHSDFGTNWPGAGNFDADPLFLNPAQRDYRLATNSPCIGTGRDGTTLGAKFPVGAAMALSHPRIESIDRDGTSASMAAHDIVRFWVDSEKTYTLQCSEVVTGGTWVKVADLFPHPRPRKVAVTNDVAGHSQRFYRLLTPRLP